MIPAKLNIVAWIGATLEPIVITFLDADSAAVDLTGWSVFAEVRQLPFNSVILDLNPSITDAANGEVTITLTDEVTATLRAGSHKWDIMLENPGGERLGPYLQGEFVVQGMITQP
jgi:hypothetical protein